MILLILASVISVAVLWAPAGAGRLRRPNAVGILVMAHALLALLPAMEMLGDPSRPIATLQVSALAISMPLLLVGAMLWRIATGGWVGQRISLWVPEKELTQGEVESLVSFIRIGTLIAGFLLVALFVAVRSIPILTLFEGSDLLLVSEQRASTSSAGFLFNVARLFFVPFLAALVAASWRHLKVSGSRFLGGSALVIALVYCSYSSRKTPVVSLLAVVLVAVLYRLVATRAFGRLLQKRARKRRVRLGRLLVVFLAIGMLAYPVLVFAQKPYGDTRTVGAIITGGVGTRISSKPASNTYYAFEMYPEATGGFTYGRDIPLVARLTGQQPVDMSSLIAIRQGFHPDVNSPSTSIGVFWAQSGWVGVVLGSVSAGLVFAFAEQVLRRLRGHPVGVALMAMLFLGAVRFSIGYFHAVVLTETILPILVTVLLWRVWSSKRHVIGTVSQPRRGPIALRR